jgi:release factor glutamine methyltransferase
MDSPGQDSTLIKSAGAVTNTFYVGDVQDRAIRRLKSAGLESYRLEADLIVAHVTGVDRVTLFAHPEIPIEANAVEKIESLLNRRITGYPLAYLLGQWEFYGIQIDVTKGVLIPRDDTETLIEVAVELLFGHDCLVADLGCGSGCISIALATAIPELEINAYDLSDIAIDTTQHNIDKHNLADRVHVSKQDLQTVLVSQPDSYQAILSNPPYIESAAIDGLQIEISQYEPREALDGGPDGLKFYPSIFTGAYTALKQGGFVAVEVGAGQAARVVEIAESSGLRDVRCVTDLAGIDRVVVGFK